MEYFKDYYVNGKYFGSESNVQKDRDTFGFYGRKSELTIEKIVLSNKKVIKPNTLTITELQILCEKK